MSRDLDEQALCVECCVDLDTVDPVIHRCTSCGGLLCWMCHEFEQHEIDCGGVHVALQALAQLERGGAS